MEDFDYIWIRAEQIRERDYSKKKLKQVGKYWSVLQTVVYPEHIV